MTLEQVRNTQPESASQILNAQWEGPGNTATPPRPWAEIGIEEKIERLREELIVLRSRWRRASSQAMQTSGEIERLIHHSHDALGNVVVPFRSQHGSAGMAEKSDSPFDPLA